MRIAFCGDGARERESLRSDDALKEGFVYGWLKAAKHDLHGKGCRSRQSSDLPFRVG